MECTLPRYVSIPSKVQTTCNTFRVAAVKKIHSMQSPDDNINLFFIQGQVIYNILMPQASVRASLIVGLEYMEWNNRMEQ